MPQTPFTAEEYGDMILLYGESRRDASEALRLYRERYPSRRRPPGPHVITEAFQRIIENKPIVPESQNVVSKSSAAKRSSVTGSKTKKATQQRTPSSVKKNKIKRPISRSVIEDSRAGYCKWLIEKLENNKNFLSDILWTGERIFTNETRLSGGNLRYWSDRPLTAKELARFPIPKKYAVRAWGAIFEGRVYGPVFVPKKLNGTDYLKVINEHLVEIINKLPLNRLNTIWFQHDGTPSHCIASVCEKLDELFKDRWIGRHGPVPWPSKSQDLTPMDFFLWERIKRDVLSRTCNDNDVMRKRLVQAFDDLREECDKKPDVMKNMYADVKKRAIDCLKEENPTVNFTKHFKMEADSSDED